MRAREIPGATVLEPAETPAVDARAACEAALAEPVGAEPLERFARRGDRVVLLVPDATRETPRAAQVSAVVSRLRSAGVATADVLVLVATGAHAQAPPPEEGWGDGGLPVRIHDGRSPSLRVVGRMASVRRRFLPDFLETEAARVAAGVPGASIRLSAAATAGRARTLQVAPEVADADLVLSLGAVLPHSIAGFAGGAKMIFPGAADAASIRENHALRLHSSVRRGRIDGNLARDHFESGVRLLRARRLCLDVLSRPGGGIIGAVAGDPEAAVRAGALRLGTALAVPPAEPADLVVAFVEGPAGRTVYQATKGAAAAAPFVGAEGTVVVVARCQEGVGDLAGARRIVAMGLRTTLPPRARILLVSRAPADDVRRVGLEPRAHLEDVLASSGARRIVVLPRALHTLPAPPFSDPMTV